MIRDIAIFLDIDGTLLNSEKCEDIIIKKRKDMMKTIAIFA